MTSVDRLIGLGFAQSVVLFLGMGIILGCLALSFVGLRRCATQYVALSIAPRFLLHVLLWTCAGALAVAGAVGGIVLILEYSAFGVAHGCAVMMGIAVPLIALTKKS
jgi:hypothetical protein